MTDLDAALREMVREVVREEVRAALADVTKPADYLSTGEAATFARVAPGTIRRWIKEKRLEALHAGRELRLRRADLERAMRGEHAGEPDIDAMANEAVRRRLG